MLNKRRYFKLDEIGFIGTQKKRPASVVRKDKKKMGEAIKAHKAAKSARIKALVHQ